MTRSLPWSEPPGAQDLCTHRKGLELLDMAVDVLERLGCSGAVASSVEPLLESLIRSSVDLRRRRHIYSIYDQYVVHGFHSQESGARLDPGICQVVPGVVYSVHVCQQVNRQSPPGWTCCQVDAFGTNRIT